MEASSDVLNSEGMTCGGTVNNSSQRSCDELDDSHDLENAKREDAREA